MKNGFELKVFSAAMVVGMVMLASCSKNNDAGSVLSASDSQNVNSEAVSNSTANETADVSNTVMNNVSDTQLTQRTESWTIDLSGKDGRLKGTTITISGGGTKEIPQGTITIMWPTGTIGGDGITRGGTITIQYYGRRQQPGSWRRITFSGFTRNNIQVTGSYHRYVADTTISSTDLTITFYDSTNLKLTFPDTTSISRKAYITAIWDYVIATPLQSTITHKANGLGGFKASGRTRSGGTYVMTITSDLVFPAVCIASGDFFPQSGAKALVVTSSSGGASLNYVLTYGNGSTTCNKTITIQLDGKTIKSTDSSDGN